MKSFFSIAFLSTMALAGLFPAKSADAEPAVQLEAVEIVSSCAPWDGEAYRVSFHLPATPEFPDAILTASVWGKGMEALRTAASFSIQGIGGMGSDGYGEAGISEVGSKDGKVHMPISVKVEFTHENAQAVATGQFKAEEWTMTLHMPAPSDKIYIVPLRSADPHTPQFCG